MPGDYSERETKFERRPSKQIRFRTSKDGKYVMLDIIETWFFSSRYISKIADGACRADNPTVPGDETSAS